MGKRGEAASAGVISRCGQGDDGKTVSRHYSSMAMMAFHSAAVTGVMERRLPR
jgi:hypothetical protein